jgi:hypothetical protein
MIDPERERQLVRKLVESLHLSVPERRELPRGVARRELVVEVICETLNESGRFPANADLGGPFDGGIIVRGRFFSTVYWRHEVGLGQYETVRRTWHLRACSAATSVIRDGWRFQIDGVPIE